MNPKPPDHLVVLDPEGDVNPDLVLDLVSQLMAPLKTFLAPPLARHKYLEVLNALAFISAVVTTSTQDPDSIDHFRDAFDSNVQNCLAGPNSPQNLNLN